MPRYAWPKLCPMLAGNIFISDAHMTKTTFKYRFASLAAACVLGLAATSALAADSSVDALKTIDTQTGNGATAMPGDEVTVDYTGWLYDADAKDHHGKKFDSSLDRGQPFSFTLGAGRVIEGWDKGVQGMKVGGERTLIIPADMAYGAQGAGGMIPPNAPLIFDVSLKGVQK